jgi:hypothetical protein
MNQLHPEKCDFFNNYDSQRSSKSGVIYRRPSRATKETVLSDELVFSTASQLGKSTLHFSEASEKVEHDWACFVSISVNTQKATYVPSFNGLRYNGRGMKVKFCISGGENKVMELSPMFTVRMIRCLFSVLLKVPESSLSFLHLAAVLPEETTLHSLDFSKRNFITVSVSRPIRHPIPAPNSVTPRDSAIGSVVSILQTLICDSNVSIRERLLRDSTALPDLVRAVGTAEVTNRPLFREIPQLLLALFGRTAEELLNGSPPERPPSEPDPVGDFLDGLTMDDFLALSRVMVTDVPLEVAISIFLEQNKDVAATIEQINRMRPH